MSPIHQDRSADAAVAALESLPAPGAADPSGVAVGYRPGAHAARSGWSCVGS